MFDISLKDLLANDVGKITGEINKYTNNKPLKTSRMTSNAGDPMNVSLFNMSEMLMRIPAYEDPATLLSNYEQIISGGIGGLWGELSLMPGFEHLLPEDVRQTLEEASLGPDASDPVFGDQGGVGPGTEPDGSLSVTGPASKVIGLARNEIGYRENPPGTNRNKFAAIAGVANGQPWCATFLMAMFKKANMPQTGLLNPYTETSITAYERKKQAGNQPRIGALAFTNWISGRRVSHVGLVVGIEENHIISVDGNTSGPRGGGSQYNGGWVAEKRRARSSIVKYAYPKYSNLPDAAERVNRS